MPDTIPGNCKELFIANASLNNDLQQHPKQTKRNLFCRNLEKTNLNGKLLHGFALWKEFSQV